jgi:hypothetical protein
METALPRDRITLLHGETSSGAQASAGDVVDRSILSEPATRDNNIRAFGRQQASVAGGVFHNATA